MTKFVTVDKDGRATAFYDAGIHTKTVFKGYVTKERPHPESTKENPLVPIQYKQEVHEQESLIPDDAIEISDALWEKWKDDTINHKFVDGDIHYDGPTDVQLESQKKNNDILGQLAQIDIKKIRAMSDAILTGDDSRLTALENQAAILRSKLRPS